MKRYIPLLLVSSLLIGGVLTILYTAQEKWASVPNCTAAVIENNKQTGTVPFGDCTYLERGFPAKFLTDNISVAIQKTNGNKLSQRDISVTTIPQFNLKNLAIDCAIWSLAIGIVLVVFPLFIFNKHPSRH